MRNFEQAREDEERQMEGSEVCWQCGWTYYFCVCGEGFGSAADKHGEPGQYWRHDFSNGEHGVVKLLKLVGVGSDGVSEQWYDTRGGFTTLDHGATLIDDPKNYRCCPWNEAGISRPRLGKHH